MQFLKLCIWPQLLGLIARVYEPPRPVVQAPPPTEATLTGALAGILGTLMGVYISPLSGGSYFKNLMLRMTSSAGPSYLVGGTLR